MSGNPENTSVWGDANAFVAPKGTTLPADIDTEFGAGWELVGILDGSAGLPEGRSRSETDHSGWGVGIIKTTFKDEKVEVMFTALEWNETVRGLVYPGSSAGKLRFGKPDLVLFGFEVIEGDRKRRLISAGECRILTTGNIERGEETLEKYPLKAIIYPDADGDHFIEQDTALAA